MKFLKDNDIFADLFKQLSTLIGIILVVAKLPKKPNGRWTNIGFCTNT